MFLQGMLEGIARIEVQAYRLLAEKGATPVRKVYTAGGWGLSGEGGAGGLWRNSSRTAQARRGLLSWHDVAPTTSSHAPSAPFSVGGGAKNPVWAQIRQAQLGVPVVSSAHGEAAFGSALLAKQGASTALLDGSLAM